MTILPVCTILLLLTAPTLYGQLYTPDFVRFTLTNGLTVVLHQDTTTASISVNMAYHAGSSRDPKGKRGLANICGSVAALGSKHVSYRDMLRLQYFASAKITGRTTVDLVSISSTFPAEYLDAALWVEADRMKNSAEPINENTVQSITENLVNQRRQAAKDPLGDVDDKIYAELYPMGHPYNSTSMGDTSDIKTIRARDVSAFLQRYYVPANASLTIAGNFDLAEARLLVSKHFEDIPAGQSARWGTLPTLPALGVASIVKEDIVSNSRLYIIVPTVPRSHPDAAALDLLAKFMAGTANAYLQTRLVDKNPQAYAVETSQSSRELDGNFWIIINCSFEASMKDIFAQVEHEIRTLAKAPLTNPDYDQARNYSKLLYHIAMEEPFGMGNRAEIMNCDALLEGSPLFTPLAVESQLRLSAGEMQTILNRYFTFDNVFALSIVPNGAGARGPVFD